MDPRFNLGDFVEILTGPNAGELGQVYACDPTVEPETFAVRNRAGARGEFVGDDIKLVVLEQHGEDRP